MEKNQRQLSFFHAKSVEFERRNAFDVVELDEMNERGGTSGHLQPITKLSHLKRANANANVVGG